MVRVTDPSIHDPTTHSSAEGIANRKVMIESAANRLCSRLIDALWPTADAPLGSKKCFTTYTKVTIPQMGSGNTAQARADEHNFAKIYEGHSRISFDSIEKPQNH
jgi:hypothetical protein